jgi:hypothetical protein
VSWVVRCTEDVRDLLGRQPGPRRGRWIYLKYFKDRPPTAHVWSADVETATVFEELEEAVVAALIVGRAGVVEL